MQQYFIKQFAECSRSASSGKCCLTGTMTETRTIEGNDPDKNFSDLEIYPDIQRTNTDLAATGTFTDSIESIDQDINRADFFSL